MKITNIECLVAAADRGSNLVYVRTNTDAGVHGIGEIYHVGPDMASPRWVEYFEEQLIGRDPTEIERNWALCYQGARFPIGSSGMAALSAIDQSLWDITGKALDIFTEHTVIVDIIQRTNVILSRHHKVIHTMVWCRMHTTGTGLGGYMITKNNGNLTIVEWVL